MGAPHVVVIGAGIGGLTAAALLLEAGAAVTVLEAHVYPGGSAGTFFHRGYRFDAGATLAGGFGPGGPHDRLAERLGLQWPIQPADPAWTVHLPDGRLVTQWADAGRWADERQHAFPGAAAGRFWRRQERLADLAWDISSRPFPWPPMHAADLATLLRTLRPRTLRALPYLTRTVRQMAPDLPDLQLFLDAQLLIAAQTTARHTNALYGSAALDLPRRGVNHVRGGIGSLAVTLAEWIRAHGGQVLYRQQVTRIRQRAGRAVAVETSKGLSVAADFFLANTTPWGLAALLTEPPRRLARETERRPATWGAFTLYLGVDAAALERVLPAGRGDHHQIIVDPTQPLGEGNSVFISIGPQEEGRAPDGHRPVTISTHTAVQPWWRLRQAATPDAYHRRRDAYSARVLEAAEQGLPGLRAAVRLQKPGTPLTFAFYTRRPRGMVGGFPQTSLLRARAPWSGIPNLLLVGDSIFPGQSTAGVTLGGMRVAREALRRLERPAYRPVGTAPPNRKRRPAP